MRINIRALALSLASAALLGACGGGSDDNQARLRLLNASIGYAALDMAVDDTTVNSAVAYGAVGDYADVDTAETGTEVRTSGVGSTVASTTPSLTAGYRYTLIAYGAAGSARTTLLEEEQDEPDSGKSKLLVLNLAPDAGALDVYVTASSETLDASTAVASSISAGAGSGYNTLTAGTYRVRLTAAGSKTDVRLDMPAVTLPSEGVQTLILTGTSGGVLVNGLLLAQTGGVTAYANATARARLVAAVDSNATVGATRGDTTLMTTSRAPGVGDYKTVTAGADSLSIVVNGSAVPVSTPTLAAGGDYTLMVWGTAASPQLTVLTDDNRLPATSAQARIRLINGVSSNTTGLTLNVDYSPLASNVMAGSSSTPVTTTASTSTLLTVTSPASTTPVYSLSELAIQSYGVYTVFVMGGDANPIGSLRKER